VKFRILPKVNRFTDAKGVRHKPGDIVDLPTSYLGESWLEPVEKTKKVKAPVAKLEKVVEEKPVPLGKPKKGK